MLLFRYSKWDLLHIFAHLKQSLICQYKVVHISLNAREIIDSFENDLLVKNAFVLIFLNSGTPK